MRCGALEAAEKLDFDYLEMKKSTNYFRRILEFREQRSMPNFRFDYAPLGLDPEWHLSAGKSFNHEGHEGSLRNFFVFLRVPGG